MGAAGADPKAVGLARRLLLGRDRELEHLYGMIDQIGRRGGALVVRGEAGIGKSALLEAAGERAREQGATVVTTTGTQSEARLAFGGLHQLLLPFLDRVDHLPDPQRRALDIAFGVSEGDAPDVFLVGLATLGVVTEREAQTPLLLVVEDAHWLDRSSAEVLAFVARRLEMEPVILLFAVRDGVPSDLDEAGLPDLALAGLDDDASRTLLEAERGRPVRRAQGADPRGGGRQSARPDRAPGRSGRSRPDQRIGAAAADGSARGDVRDEAHRSRRRRASAAAARGAR